MGISKATINDSAKAQASTTPAPPVVTKQSRGQQHPIGNQAMLRRLLLPAPHVQYRLQVGATNDPLEVEADQVAEQVMRMSDGGAEGCRTQPTLLRKCASCEEEDKVHRKPTDVGPAFAPPSVHDVLRTSGHPMDATTRSAMEGHFQRDFSRVRVHTDDLSGESARSVGALAYTVRDNIVFAPGQYKPQDTAGLRLLAHELAHVVQQSGSTGMVQRAVSRGAGGCAPPTEIDEDDEGAKSAGKTAHTQIQAFLLPILNEVQIPRATKKNVDDTGCQAPGVKDGFADLLRRTGILYDVAEIKPIGSAPSFGVRDAEHYIRRGEQSMDRFFGSGPQCGTVPAGDDDKAFARRLGIGGLRPVFDKLSDILPDTTVIGAFDGDPSRTLKAKMVKPGAVGYWCTGGKSDTYTCGLSDDEMRSYIDRVALGPAQDVLDKFLSERLEKPIQDALSQKSLGDLIRLGQKRFGPQIRKILEGYLGPLADQVLNDATVEQIAQIADKTLGPEVQVIINTLVRRLTSMLINELRVQLRNILANMLKETLLALCVGAPAVALVDLLEKLKETMRRQTRLLIPVVVAAVAQQIAVAMLAELQAVLSSMASALEDALSTLGSILATIGKILLRVLAVLAILLVCVGVVILAIATVLAALDPLPGDEVLVGAATVFVAGLIPLLGRYIISGSTEEKPSGA